MNNNIKPAVLRATMMKLANQPDSYKLTESEYVEAVQHLCQRKLATCTIDISENGINLGEAELTQEGLQIVSTILLQKEKEKKLLEDELRKKGVIL